MRRFRHCNSIRGHGGRPLRAQPTIPAFIETSLVAARSGLSGTAAIKQMASDMRENAYREGGLTEDGMHLLGWTPAQIKLHGTDARVLANKQQVMS